MSENKIPARSFFDWCVRRSGGNQGGIAVAAQAAFHQNGISELAVSADLDLEKAVLGEKKSGIALVEGRKAYGRHSGGCGKGRSGHGRRFPVCREDFPVPAAWDGAKRKQ